MTDSFITQAEEALAGYEQAVDLQWPVTASGQDTLATALRSLLGEYKRLTAEQEWEYAQSEVLTDGTTAYGMPVATLQDAVRRRDIDRINYPWPEELGVGRRRKAGPWVPVEGEDQ